MSIILSDDAFCSSSTGVWPTYIKWQLKKGIGGILPKKSSGVTCLLRINQ